MHNVKVCSERVAYYTHAISKKALLDMIPCEITSIDTGRVATGAMIMPLNSEYREVINYQ